MLGSCISRETAFFVFVFVVVFINRFTDKKKSLRTKDQRGLNDCKIIVQHLLLRLFHLGFHWLHRNMNIATDIGALH